MTEESFNNPDAVAFINGGTPVGRGGQDHELDAATLFLAGSGNTYVTGQTIYVDGRYTAR
jgi:NAD(P)-dependent dehydrogenase (short-subunit alcohol dehydrogenase family)